MTDGKLLSGQQLAPEQTLVSVGGHARLHNQNDGNLVVYLDGPPFWASQTAGQQPGVLKMRADGDLVLTGPDGRGRAHTNTAGHPGAMVQLQDDGNFVLYEDPNGPQAGVPIWAASTGVFVIEDVEPEPIPAHPDPIVGRLRLNGTMFVDDSGPINPCFAHAGDLFALFVRDKARALKEMDDMVVVGYYGARVWTCLGGDYWTSKDRHVGPNLTPNYWALWSEFLRELNARLLRLVVSQGDIGQAGATVNQRKAFATRMAHEAKAVDGTGFIYAFFDGGNEAWQTGEPNPDNLAAFVQAYKDAGGTAILSLTSPPGEKKEELDRFSISPADIYDVHTYRGDHWYDKRRHIFSIPYEGKPNKKNGIGSEGPGNGDLVSVCDNKHELNHEAMGCLAAASFIGRQAYVWFSGEGVMIQAGLHTQQGFEACALVARLLPRDVMAFAVIHHSGDSWKNERVLIPPSDDVRVDGASHSDGRFAFTLDGPSGTHHFVVARNFTATLYNPATGAATPIEGKAGQALSISWERGRILVGRKT